MSSTEPDNLVRIGRLKREPPTAGEVEGLIRSGRIRLRNAARKDLALESMAVPPACIVRRAV